MNDFIMFILFVNLNKIVYI